MYTPIPKSSASTIVFPYRQAIKSFDSASYSPSLTGERASFEEVTRAIQEIGKIRCSYTQRIQKELRKIFLVEAIIVIVAAILLFTNQLKSQTNLYIFFGVAFGVLLVVFSIYFRAARRIKEDFQSTMQLEITRINQFFVPKGLKWIIPDGNLPRWIELHLEVPNQVGVQQSYQPMSMDNPQNGQYGYGQNYQANQFPEYRGQTGYGYMPPQMNDGQNYSAN